MDHRIIARKFKKLAYKKVEPDIIICSLPPYDLAYQAVRYANKVKVPIIIDIRDCWPDIFLEHIPVILKIFFRICFNFEFWMLKYTLTKADYLVSVTNKFLNWGLKYSFDKSRNKNKVFPLGYKKNNLDIKNKLNLKYVSLFDNLKNKFIVFFLGTLSKSYHNPSILIQAAEKLKENKDIYFIIAGDGELFDELNARAKRLNNISLVGWLDRDEIEFFLRNTHLGICPLTNMVDLPTNKMYAYLSAGLPVISAFQGELKNLVEENKIGFYYQPNDLNSLVKCIEILYKNKDLYKEMSKHAEELFNKKFDADEVYNQYADYIEDIVLSN